MTELTMIRGVEFPIEWRWIAGDQPKDLTTYNILIQIRPFERSSTVIDSFDRNSSFVTVSNSEGVVRIVLPPSRTIAYDFKKAVVDCWIYNNSDTDGERSSIYTINLVWGVSSNNFILPDPPDNGFNVNNFMLKSVYDSNGDGKVAYSDLFGVPSFSAVATSGSYNDLSNKPTISAVGLSGLYSDLTGSPSLGTASSLNAPISGNAGLTEVVKGNDTRLTDARAPLSHNHVIGDVTGLQTSLDGKQSIISGTGLVRSTGGVISYDTSNYLTSAPVSSVAGRTGAITLTPTDINLGNVDNTSDANKPVSTAQQTALNAKQNLLAGTGFVKSTAGTISYDTSTYLTANQTVTFSGDLTGSGTTSVSLTLANSGVTAGTYNNSATQLSSFTVDAKGRVTSVGVATTITPAFSSITGRPTSISGYGITDAQALNSKLTSISGLSSSTTGLIKLTSGVASLDSATYFSNAQPILMPSGTHTAPSYSFSGASGVGFYRSASQTINSISFNSVGLAFGSVDSGIYFGDDATDFYGVGLFPKQTSGLGSGKSLSILSGIGASGEDTGSLHLGTANYNVSGSSGAVELSSGAASGIGTTSGSLVIGTGFSDTGNTGQLLFSTGSTGAGNSGSISFVTGNTSSGTAGSVTLRTGDISAAVFIQSGNGGVGLKVLGAYVISEVPLKVPQGIVGVIDASNATSGTLGEYTSSTVASGSAVSLTTATAKTVTSVSLTAGDWLVSGVVAYKPAATTMITSMQSGCNTTTNAIGSLGTYSQRSLMQVPNLDQIEATPVTRINVSSTTTVYLVANASFTVSTCSAYGHIKATRIR